MYTAVRSSNFSVDFTRHNRVWLQICTASVAAVEYDMDNVAKSGGCGRKTCFKNVILLCIYRITNIYNMMCTIRK